MRSGSDNFVVDDFVRLDIPISLVVVDDRKPVIPSVDGHVMRVQLAEAANGPR